MLPALFVFQPPPGVCWICRRFAKGSREHKIKATDIRRNFKGEVMHISNSDGSSGFRIAQGQNSRHLKYDSSICEKCNNAVTQESDNAYDELISMIEDNDSDRNSIDLAIRSHLFESTSHLFLPLFRYFAKRIGCHLAEIGAPIPIHLSRFVAKKNEKNCIWLDIREDQTFKELAAMSQGKPLPYAAHGGLIVITKAPKMLPVRVHTTMTIGPIQFIYWYTYTVFELLEMSIRHPDFIEWCAVEAQTGIDSPIQDSCLNKHGLYREDIAHDDKLRSK